MCLDRHHRGHRAKFDGASLGTPACSVVDVKLMHDGRGLSLTGHPCPLSPDETEIEHGWASHADRSLVGVRSPYNPSGAAGHECMYRAYPPAESDGSLTFL